MIIFATIVILLVVFALVLRNLQNSPREERRRGYWRLGLAATAVILIGLILTGRMHWLGALFGLALPLGKMVFHALADRVIRSKIDPQTSDTTKTAEGTRTATKPSAELNLDEAHAILGVAIGASSEQIEAAYRSLMQKLHPDHGGNDFLASQLNRARARLLTEAQRKSSGD